MAALVAAFNADAPIDWRLKPLVTPGTLAVVAGQGGSGKTWVMHEAAQAVITGGERAGMQGRSGTALIVDGEMGQHLTVQRFKQQGWSTDLHVFDATTLNIARPEGRQELWAVIQGLRPDFIGLDSLSALTAGADENSRETGDLVRWIANAVCKGTEGYSPAAMLIHHAGWKEERTRGSSTIRDAADAVWYFGRAGEGAENERALTCRGASLKAPRWCAPPAVQYMRLRETGGLEKIDAPTNPTAAKAATREQLVYDAIKGGAKLKSLADLSAAAGLARNNNTGARDVRDAMGLHKGEDGWFELNGYRPPGI